MAKRKTSVDKIISGKADIAGALTMDHIATLTQLSKATVSRALRDSPLVTEATKALVNDAAKKCGYTVNKNAKKLRDKRTNTIAISLDFPSYPGQRISDPFIFELLSDIVNALSVREQDVLLCLPDANSTLAYQNILAAKNADGIIFLGQGDKGEILEELAKLKAPFVVWGGVPDEPGYCTVGSDNVHGGYMAGNRFALLGCSNILFIGNTRHLENQLRRDGLEAGLKEGGKENKITDLVLNDYTYETAYTAAKRILSDANNSVDAVFATSDIIAIAVCVALREAGLTPGKDVPVIGYNDIPVASYFSPAISTVRQDTLQAGGLLVEKLMQILAGFSPKSVKLPTNLIIRDT